jgi:hypothetical protein
VLAGRGRRTLRPGKGRGQPEPGVLGQRLAPRVR